MPADDVQVRMLSQRGGYQSGEIVTVSKGQAATYLGRGEAEPVTRQVPVETATAEPRAEQTIARSNQQQETRHKRKT